MANNKKTFVNGLSLEPVTTTGNTKKGDVEILASDGRIYYFNSTNLPLVDPSSTDTLTNKSISGSTNTLTNIPNGALTNSDVTINGSSVSLGGSVTVTATATNPLTIGTGLSGTSYDGSTPVTVAIDSTVATLTGTQTLTNKTLTAPKISTISNTGTLTLPTSTDTLVGTATTDTLTNKTIVASNNTISSLTNSNLNGSAAITNANLATVPTLTLKGNNTGGSAVPQDLTVAQVNTMLGSFSNPTGTVLEFAGPITPTGYEPADGAAISRTTFSDLFAVIGTIYGAGDGSTTFNKPNRQAIFARGAGSQTIGGKTFTTTLGVVSKDTTAQNGLALNDPGHQHNQRYYNGTAGGTTNLPNIGLATGTPINIALTGASTTSITLGSTDTETAPAYIVMNYIIKT